MVTGKLKFLVLILIFVFGINMISVQSFAAGTSVIITTSDGYMFNTETGIITGYIGNGGDIEIPSQINGIKVIGIGNSAFYSCKSLKAINIPNGVTSIGDCAFSFCRLTDITIPNSVTSIGIEAFCYCRNLKAITIPGSVTSIGISAFAQCESLTDVTIQNGVSSIGSYEFYNCSSLTGVSIPDSVTSICELAFGGCSSLTGIIIPNSVSSIDSTAFDRCTSLTSVTIPSSVSSICSFSGCSRLSAINVDAANANYSSLNGVLFDKTQTTLLKYPKGITATSYNIPSTVANIGDSAFSECTGLISITIPDSVTSIGDYAFFNCTGLISITIPDSVTSISDYAFYQCTGLISITIPDSVTSIGDYAFYRCTSLKNITFPGVTYLGWAVFSECHLESVTIPKSLESFYCLGGGSGDGGPLSECRIKNIIFEDGITDIQSDLFFMCGIIENITIPNSVTSIGQDISKYHHDLTIITYPGTYADKYAQSNNMTVKYSVPEDINGDMTVNMKDIILAASHFNTTSTGSDYDIKCDLNNDKVINLIDIMMIAAKFNYVY